MHLLFQHRVGRRWILINLAEVFQIRFPVAAVLPITVHAAQTGTSRASRCSHGRGRSEGDQSVEIVHSVALHVVAPSSRAVTCEQGRVARQI